ncbi:MAG: hypothetical protein KBT40_05820 [bacterium]|nr:hypothetical protein [Candidatus Minthenecus merdequi]
MKKQERKKKKKNGNMQMSFLSAPALMRPVGRKPQGAKRAGARQKTQRRKNTVTDKDWVEPCAARWQLEQQCQKLPFN